MTSNDRIDVANLTATNSAINIGSGNSATVGEPFKSEKVLAAIGALRSELHGDHAEVEKLDELADKVNSDGGPGLRELLADFVAGASSNLAGAVAFHALVGLLG